jgi:biopolymer transport protein TolR
VKVDLPEASARSLPQSQAREPPVVLTIDREGQRFLNVGDVERALGDTDLEQAVRAALVTDPQRDVLIRADTNVPYGRVIGAMVVLQGAGAAKLGFVTDPPSRGKP